MLLLNHVFFLICYKFRLSFDWKKIHGEWRVNKIGVTRYITLKLGNWM